MSQAAVAGGFQVRLTGQHLDGVADMELRQRLQQHFALSAKQAERLLAGPRVVRDGVDLGEAARLAGLFRRCGLEARVEAMPAPIRAAPPQEMPRPARPAAVAPAAEPQTLQSLPRRQLPAVVLDRRQRLRLFGIATLAVLVPLAYFGPVAFIAGDWLWSLLQLHRADSGLVTLVTSHLLLGAVGAMLMLFLAKPLLAPRRRRPNDIAVARADEPEFVRGVEALCAAISVPAPAEVRFDGTLDARLEFADGWRSWWKDRRVLRIGLPLVAGLTARELAGVLASALAHGASPARLRCFVLINRLNAWLERCAFEPDPWDERLEHWHETSEHPAVRSAASLAAMAIATQQGLLGHLARLCQALTRPLLQELIAIADRYEAVIAGSEHFRMTARNRRALAQAAEDVEEANARAWSHGRLLQDVPEAIDAEFRAMDDERLAAIETEMESPLLRCWEPHPADVDRIEAVQAEALPGLFTHDTPAHQLLQQAAHWNREITEARYREQGLDYSSGQLHARHSLWALKPPDPQAEVLDRFFNGQFQPWPMLRLRLPSDPALANLGWQEAIDTLRQRSPELTREWAAVAELEQRRPRLLLAAALKVKPTQFGLPDLDGLPTDELLHYLERIRTRGTEAHRHLQIDLTLHAFRIQCCVNALEGTDRGRGQALRALLAALYPLETAAATLVELRSAADLLQQRRGADAAPEVDTDLLDIQRLFAEQATRLLEGGMGLPQRFAEGDSVGGYLLRCCPGAALEGRNDSAQYLRDARGLPEAFQKFYRLCLAELIALCEAAERRSGITPIRRL